MSDPYREQRPLLCDEYSDEEFHVKNYQKRNQPSVCIGRARTHAKGAAAVLVRWPDNCSTSVTYWWLGVAMIAVTVFVIYNSVLIFGMIPAQTIKQPRYRTFNNGIKLPTRTFSLPEVYMHLIIDNANVQSNEQLNKYLPLVDAVSKQYPSFKYNFLLVINDTLKDTYDFNDDQRNKIAFESLWANENNVRKVSNKYNISVEYKSMTAYLNESPIKKFWRHLPLHLIPFLLRSVSIWEKGGIVFNPVILSNTNYTEKLFTLFNKYMNSSGKFVETKVRSKVSTKVNKKRPNNIQDIINSLNAEHNNTSDFDLNEAENKEVIVEEKLENGLPSKLNLNYTTKHFNRIDVDSKEYNAHNEDDTNLNEKKDNMPSTTDSTYTTDNILPLFIKYLFHIKPEKELINKSNLKDIISSSIPIPDKAQLDDSISYDRNVSLIVENISNMTEKHDEHNDTVNISTKMNNQISGKNTKNSKYHKYSDMPELSIDIKGNIIASKTACHALLGTIFSNVIHHTEEETLTDFIISELSLFCNGLLTSCAGINVILV